MIFEVFFVSSIFNHMAIILIYLFQKYCYLTRKVGKYQLLDVTMIQFEHLSSNIEIKNETSFFNKHIPNIYDFVNLHKMNVASFLIIQNLIAFTQNLDEDFFLLLLSQILIKTRKP